MLAQYKRLGYEYLTKGYPDFCFYNDKEIIFVEVKVKCDTPKRGLSIHQKKMHEIFRRLGIEVKVIYVY